MASEIYLIRHGLIDYKTQQLNSDGQQFSQDLVSILGDKGIQFMGWDTADTKRCLQTILPLAKSRGIECRECAFKDGLPLTELENYSTVAFCYRIASFERIKLQLGLEIPDARDKTYEYIYHIEKQEDGAWSFERIPTGFRKSW
jgi:hypothetical protein